MDQPGFFDLDNRYESISNLGDPLEVLDQAIPWETFRPVLGKTLRKFKKSNAGRKPYETVFMFKTLVLQSLYNLSDDQTEFQIKDRLSFMRFLRLDFEDTVLDAKTLWLFRDTLANKMPSTNCSANSIGNLMVKVCLHVKGNSLMPALFRFLCNAILRKKMPTSNKVKSRKTGKSNRTNFNRRIWMPVG
jgi:hypothetical protein